MTTLFPITLHLNPAEYDALHELCQDVATVVMYSKANPARLSSGQLLLADFFARTFTAARVDAWQRKKATKEYAFRLGLIYARLLRTYMQRRPVDDFQQAVLAKLDQALTNRGESQNTPLPAGSNRSDDFK